MLELNTIRITKNIPFQMYLLSDKLVKKVHQEFEFYNVRFYREERVSELTVCLDYPKGNVYWFVDFKKFILNEILSKDARYEKEWNEFLYRLKKTVWSELQSLENDLKNIKDEDIAYKMRFWNLRDYQALNLIQLKIKMRHGTNPAGLILSEQRTGKTRVALAAAYETLGAGGMVLVVCPKSAQLGWISEIEELNATMKCRIFEKMCIEHIKDIKDSVANYSSSACNLRIISYDLFKKLTRTQIYDLICKSMISKEIVLIGDEAHRLRNFDTLQSDALFKFKDICARNKLKLIPIGMTGTPAVKDSYDIFGLLSFINFSSIGFFPYKKDFNQFKEYFYNCEDTSFGKVCKSLKRTAELQHLIRVCSVQTKQNTLDIFRNYTKKYVRIDLEMDDIQKTIYKALINDMAYEKDIDCENGLVLLTRLQQICTDPSSLVSSYERVAPKLQWIVDFAKRKDWKFIVMSKKTQHLKQLLKQLNSAGVTCSYVDGTLSTSQRASEIDKFKTNATRLILIQQDTGKESLTLPEAKCTIFLDRDFAQGFNEQAESRMTPIDGSKCAKFVVDLVMLGTVEENIYDILVNRKESIDTINTVVKFNRKEET